MSFTIGEAAARAGVTTATLRFYDKEQLLPDVERTGSGRRVFSEEDLCRLNTIECLKNTGMPLKEIRQYIALCTRGDDTLERRLEIFRQQKQNVEEQIETLHRYMARLEGKIAYYQAAIEAGTEDAVKGMSCEGESEG